MDGPDGTVAHAEPDFGNGRLQPGDPAEAYQIAAAEERDRRMAEWAKEKVGS